jgi:hypothetical protein
LPFGLRGLWSSLLDVAVDLLDVLYADRHESWGITVDLNKIVSPDLTARQDASWQVLLEPVNSLVHDERCPEYIVISEIVNLDGDLLPF